MPTVAPLDIEGHVVSTHFLGDIPVFAAASGAIHRLDGGEKVTEANAGLLTCVKDPTNQTHLTGGEDGRVLRVAHDGTVTELAHVPRKWISVVAAGPQGAIAYARGQVHPCPSLRRHDQGVHRRAHGRGDRLVHPRGCASAVARYKRRHAALGGHSRCARRPRMEGAHTGVTFSPDGRFVVTMMQESALHGWKLDGKVRTPATCA